MNTSNPIRKITLSIATWAARSPWMAIGTVALMTLVFCVGLSSLRIDASNSAMFGANDSAQIDYQVFQKEFGREDTVVVAISSDKIFDASFMARLRTLHNEIEQTVPWVDEVISLASVTYVDQADGAVQTSKLGDRWPSKGSLSPALRADILASPLYRRTLLSDDGMMTVIAVRPQTYVTQDALDSTRLATQHGGTMFERMGLAVREWHDNLDRSLGVGGGSKPESTVSVKNASDVLQVGDEPQLEVGGRIPVQGSARLRLPNAKIAEFNASIRAVTDRYRSAGFEISVSGGPMIDEAHEDSVHRDAGLMTTLSLLVVIIALAVQLRSVVGVALPVIVIVASLLTTLGMMGWIGYSITAVSQALPPILLTMGVLSSVHLLTHYLQDSEPDFEKAIQNMFNHSGDPVVYTVLTDVLAFLAFSIARLEPISQFGLMAAFGSFLGLIYTILLLPALLRLARVKQRKTYSNGWFFDKLTATVTPIGLYCCRHYRLVLALTLSLILLMLPGIMRINYAHDVLTWFKPDNVLRVDTLSIDAKMRATVPLEIIIDTGQDNGILTSQFMVNLRALQDYGISLSDGKLQVGSATSIVDSIERVHFVLTGGKDGRLPKTDKLLNQELLLYEGGGAKEIRRLTDRRYSKARVTMRMAWADAHVYVGLDQRMRSKAQELFGSHVKVTITGTAYMQSVGALDVIDSMWSSYLLSAALIVIMLYAVLKELKISLASIVPNFLPVWISLGVMGYLGLPVDMFMVLLGGIALAVSVDDTVHFMHTVMRYRRKNGDQITEAVRQTLQDVGAPLVIASVVVACGFFTFFFSSIVPLSRFGLILSCTIVLALVLDLIVSPALVTALSAMEQPRHTSKSDSKNGEIK